MWDNGSSNHWVAPFGNLRITEYVLLPVAYRSLSRPSSPLRPKAFPVCSFVAPRLLFSVSSYHHVNELYSIFITLLFRYQAVLTHSNIG